MGISSRIRLPQPNIHKLWTINYRKLWSKQFDGCKRISSSTNQFELFQPQPPTQYGLLRKMSWHVISYGQRTIYCSLSYESYGMTINQNKSMLDLNIGRKYTKPVPYFIGTILKMIWIFEEKWIRTTLKDDHWNPTDKYTVELMGHKLW